MNLQEFLHRLRELVLADRDLQLEDPLSSFPGWDSMGQVSIVSFLDEALGVQLPAGALQKCVQVADLVRLVESHLKT